VFIPWLTITNYLPPGRQLYENSSRRLVESLSGSFPGT